MSVSSFFRSGSRRACGLVLATMVSPAGSMAQSPVAQAQPATSSQNNDGSLQNNDGLRFRMPTVTVTAWKEEEDKQKVPVSVTAVSRETIDSADIHIVSD